MSSYHEMQIVRAFSQVAVMQNGQLIEKKLGYFLLIPNELTQNFVTTTRHQWGHDQINQQRLYQNLPENSILAHLKYSGVVTDTAIINDIYKQYPVCMSLR